jgi:hypothetical protein
MTQSSFPFENADTNETQYSRLLRHIASHGRAGVNGVPGDNNLKVSAGTGMTVSVSSGQALVRGHYYVSTAAEVLTIAASGAQPRIDSIILRLDPSANSIILAVLQGTPGATPSAPALTQNDTTIFEVRLANVLVAAGASNIDNGAITDLRQFIANVWTTSARPTPVLGLTGYNTTTSKLESYNGTAWVEQTPNALDASVITTGTFDAARIPSLDASKITSGTLGTARIPDLDSAKITTGTLGSDRIPDLDVAKITSGVLPLARGGVGADTQAGARATIGAAASSHTHGASDIVSGTLDSARIPNLDATKTTSGTFDIARIPTISVAKGGTGATDASTARSNLGAAAASHTHDGSQIVSGSIDVPGSIRGTSFSINNGAGGSSVTMAQNGTVAIGTRLDVIGISNVTGSLYNGGAYSTSVAYGAYRALWVNSDGLFGHTASNRASKQDIVPTSLNADAILDAEIVDFRYKVAVEKEGDDAALEIGVIAEQLIDAGLERFVFYGENGEPEGVHYERLAIAIIPQLQKQAQQIADIETRLSKLEK